jgi:Transposase DDE domain
MLVVERFQPAMRNIKAVHDLAQNALFDSATLDACSWWVTDLHECARRRLEESWPGIFRRSLLKLMPAEQLGTRFDPTLGRPTKELHAMAALVFIMEFKDYTNEEAADAYTYDNSIHFALNLPNRHNYLCTRTLESYRALVREDEAASVAFMDVTRALVEALNIDVSIQRLDSTHLLSDMANFGRTKLLAISVKRLLTAIKRHLPERYASLGEDLLQRYEPAPGRLFGEASTSKEGRARAQLQVAQDMHHLIEHFADDAQVRERSTYTSLVRLFSEHCELKDKQVSVRKKAQDSNGQSSHTLQNPSDADAGYSGHKGAGYQVQLSETSAKDNPVQLIVACIPQSAGDQDAQALAPVIEQLQGNQMEPTELAADTAYGSDANYQQAKQEGITLISPVPGAAPKNGHSAQAAAGDSEAPPKPRGRDQTTEQSRAEQGAAKRNAERRQEQESEAWKDRYRRRAGSESTNRGLDRRTGIKELRVRGMQSVAHSIYAKVMGWNILQSARALAKVGIAARKAAKAAVKMQWARMKTNRLRATRPMLHIKSAHRPSIAPLNSSASAESTLAAA